jgi:hypothetical protein
VGRPQPRRSASPHPEPPGRRPADVNAADSRWSKGDESRARAHDRHSLISRWGHVGLGARGLRAALPDSRLFPGGRACGVHLGALTLMPGETPGATFTTYDSSRVDSRIGARIVGCSPLFFVGPTRARGWVSFRPKLCSSTGSDVRRFQDNPPVDVDRRTASASHCAVNAQG